MLRSASFARITPLTRRKRQWNETRPVSLLSDDEEETAVDENRRDRSHTISQGSASVPAIVKSDPGSQFMYLSEEESGAAEDSEVQETNKPKTILELGIPFPNFTIIVAKGEREPATSTLESLRKHALQGSTDASGNQIIPQLNVQFSPFLCKLKTSFAGLQDCLAANAGLAGQRSDDGKLLRAGESNLYFRDADRPDQNENDIRRSACKPSCFRHNYVPYQHFNAISPKGGKEVSDNKTLWGRKYAEWSRTTQQYVFKIMRTGMQGLVQIYTFEVFAQFSDQQIRQLLGDIFRAAPVEHSLAMWAKIADTIDIQGIYRVSEDVEEEKYCSAWRKAMEYRFVEVGLLVSRYIINVDPNQVEKYKKTAFLKWKKLGKDTKGYLSTLDLGTYQDVPVQATIEKKRKLAVSYFDLSTK